jgi:Phosphodiester glycosidase
MVHEMTYGVMGILIQQTPLTALVARWAIEHTHFPITERASMKQILLKPQNFMSSHRHLLILLPIVLLTGCIPPNQAVTPTPKASPIFTETTIAPGIKMLTSPTSKGNNHIIEVDLSKAELRSLSGKPTPTGKVGQMTFAEFALANKNKETPKVLINGTFFREYDKPTGIAFGLKQNKQLITYGYGLNEFPDQTLTIEWSQGRISIDPYSQRTFNGAMPNVVGALAATAGKNANKPLPRTFVGVKNLREDSAYNTVLLFSSPSATQSEAEQTLKKFGAEQIAMLDGGSSTGLMVNGKIIMQPKTKLPQTIGVFSK